jgi:hypothetical protein
MVESTTYLLKMVYLKGKLSMQFLAKSLRKKFNTWMSERAMTPEERYLSRSSSLVDLENRQRELMYGRQNRNTFFAGH